MTCLPSISLPPACLRGLNYIPSAHLVALTLLRELIEFFSSPRSRFLLLLLLTFHWDKTCCLHIATHLPPSTVKFTSVMSAGRLWGLTGSGISPLCCYISSMCHHVPQEVAKRSLSDSINIDWLRFEILLCFLSLMTLHCLFFHALLFPAVVKHDFEQVEIVWSSFFVVAVFIT